ncbi:hepatitis A virus cellular receptor 2-like isoform X2 [Simochromis diagramma]|uniref:hepatitis A virus cellular receptor 2-like isoform X2 n=1 Tax=Simochromis diagramma TaxID=43689 RepID=UPI001A7EE083|nr:hepatitis A virus cellular receptor 2-like isoform X2 [Simochromis diagramma]
MSAETTSLCSTLLFVGLFVFVSADINTTAGQDVTLPCRAPNNNIRAVEWSRADLKEEQHVLLYRDDQFVHEGQHRSFKNRVDLQDRQMKDGDVSLILNNVTTADSGTYKCHVFMSGTNNEPISNITLSVVDPPGQTGGDTEDGSVGLKVGLSVAFILVVVVVVVVVVFVVVIYSRYKQQSQDSHCPNVEPKTEMSECFLNS